MELFFIGVIAAAAAIGALRWWLARSPPSPVPSADDGDSEGRLSHRRARRSVAGFSHLIEYADADGVVTERQISIKSVSEDFKSGIIYVSAYCGLRGEDRLFRAERILSLTDLSTGDDVDSPLVYFSRYPGIRRQTRSEIMPDLYEPPVDTRPKFDVPETHERVMARARAGLRGLMWLAAAEGGVSEAEVGVLLGWIEYRARTSRGSAEEWSREAALALIKSERPTLADVRGGLARMGKGEAAEFLATMERMIVAEGEAGRLSLGRRARLRAFLPPV